MCSAARSTPARQYVTYVVPGIILLCASFGSATTAVSVCNDMVSGIVDRFRSMPILGSAVLTGHVVASLLRNLAAGGGGHRRRAAHGLPPQRERRWSGSA